MKNPQSQVKILMAIFVLIASFVAHLLDFNQGLDIALEAEIFWHLRLPRAAVTILVGSCLALAGYCCQSMFQNPLASPSILGTSSGAMFFSVCLFFLLDMHRYWFLLPFSAFFGALLVNILIVMLMKIKNYKVYTLLIMGIVINSFFSSITSLIVSLHSNDPQKLSYVMAWFWGSTAFAEWWQVWTLMIILLISVFILLKMAKIMDCLIMDVSYVRTLGVSVERCYQVLIMVVAGLVGGSIAVAGMVGFVGIVVPQITRLIFVFESKTQMVGNILLGGIFLLWTDLFCKSAIAGMDLQLGIMTGLVGVPFIFYFLHKNFGGSRV